MDGDGDLDVIAPIRVESHPDMLLFRNDGTGGLSAPAIVAERPGAGGVVAVDMDGDGNMDIVNNANGNSSVDTNVWLENSSGSGTSWQSHTISDASSTGIDDVIVLDLDGHGDLDVATQRYVFRNLSDDCNSNAVPDICEPDCNSNGVADECDINLARSVDCNANSVRDECDTTCTGDCDADADGCLDDLDCAPADGSLWGAPGSVARLLLSGTTTTTLNWQPPAYPGADSVRYDTLRSPSTDDFAGPATCIETDDADTSAEDLFVPDPGELACYLIRVGNACPGGASSLGNDSAGEPRDGSVCP